jgi:hypothetical protein
MPGFQQFVALLYQSAENSAGPFFLEMSVRLPATWQIAESPAFFSFQAAMCLTEAVCGDLGFYFCGLPSTPLGSRFVDIIVRATAMRTMDAANRDVSKCRPTVRFATCSESG